jgi:hypothetical protein
VSPRPGRRRLSASQERLWFLERLNQSSGLYNEHVCVRFAGTLNLPALHQALSQVARRHESLRWVIAERDGRVEAQAGAALLPGFVRVVDLEGLPSDERERAYRVCATEAARRPFDLALGPLARVLLGRLSPGESALTLVMHHIVSDAWSMRILVADVCAAYRAAAGGTPWVGEAVDYSLDPSPRDDAQDLGYWTARLADTPAPVSLPAHRPRPTQRTFGGAKRYFELDRDAAACLRRVQRDERVTPFIALLALWSSYLAACTGSRDLVVGTTTSGREDAADRRVGFFANTLAIRTRCAPGESFRDYLRQVRTVTLEALEHERVPFEHVVRALPLARLPNRQPLFEVMFIYVNAAVLALDMQGLEVRITPEDATLGLCKFDLVVSFYESGSEIRGIIDYSTELYDAAEIDAHIARFSKLAGRALGDPDRPLAELVPVEAPPLGVLEDLRSLRIERALP